MGIIIILCHWIKFPCFAFTQMWQEQHKDIDDEKRKLFEAFEMLEDAR